MRANRIWQDDEGRVVLWQSPNVWLIIWAISEAARFVLPMGKAETSIRWAGTGALAVWAILEIFQGINYFRRGLGLIVLFLTTASIFKAIF